MMKRMVLQYLLLQCVVCAAWAQPLHLDDPEELNAIALSLSGEFPDSAFQYAKALYDYAYQASDEYYLIKAKILVANYFFNTFQLDTAGKLLLECEAYFDARPSQRKKLDYGRVHYNLGQLSLRKQELRLSKIYAQQALKVFEEINDVNYTVETLRLLGWVEMSIGNHAGSLEHYLAALELSQTTENLDPSVHANLLLNISTGYRQMGQLDKSREYVRRGYRLMRNANDQSSVPYALNALGMLHMLEKNLDSAVYYYETSKSVAMAINAPDKAFVAEYNLANMYSQLDMPVASNKRVKEALANYKQYPGGMRESSEYLLAKNYQKLGKHDSSIFVARSTLSRTMASKSKQFSILLTEVLANAYEAKGVADSAMYYLKLHYAYKDSVYNLENQRKLSNVYAEMETIAKQKEIQLLQRDAALQKSEIRLLVVWVVGAVIIGTMTVVLVVLYHRNKQKQMRLRQLELEDELEQKKQALHQQTLRIIHINNGLSEIESTLRKIKSDEAGNYQDVKHVLSSIHFSKSLEKEWNNFDQYFGSVHIGFFEKIKELCPALTIMEKRLAGLVKMNLTNGEIASILNIESKSVKMAKYRLKKKLGLTDEQDMAEFLQSIGERPER